jgi:hypothetical protein
MKTTALAWVAGLWLAALPVLGQGSVTPPGSGTAVDPYRIAELGHLVWMSDTVASSAGTYYALQNDIAAAATATWNDAGTAASLLEGFRPIGTEAAPFAGAFDGQDHVIRSLTVDRPERNAVGLFGWIRSGGVVRRLGLEGGSVTGNCDVGGLAGHNGSGTLTQCHASGAVTGAYYVGGLLGRQDSGTVEQCYASGAVTAAGSVGGLVGYNERGVIRRGYATGELSGDYSVGGLLGYNAGTVEQGYATGAVTGADVVGGLLGYNEGGTVGQCYATGPVAGVEDVGGLVGYNESGAVEQCYATGAVAGADYVGGLLGENDGTLTQCYATGAVAAGRVSVGGLAGGGSGPVGECYWDMEESGWATSAGGAGRTTAQMRQQSTYADWDFATAWEIVAAGQSYPSLRWSPPPFALVTVGRGPGSVAVDPVQMAYAAGAVVTLHAVAVAGAEFVRWLGPVAIPTAAQTTVTVAGPLTVVGLFRVARGIASVQELQKIGRDPAYPLNGRYWLTQDVDATETATWNDAGTDASVAEGFLPLGTEGAGFAGELDGQGHLIRGLTIHRPESNAVGLFGWIGSNGVVRRLGLEGGSVTGSAGVGGLAGANAGTLTDCYAAAAVRGDERVGGLLGYSEGGTVTQCYATGAVAGGDYVGGLLGQNEDGTVTQCYATGAVAGGDSVGGLLGQNEDGTVAQCYATGAASGRDSVGGLLGGNDGTVAQCFATGAASGVNRVGGLLGQADDGTLTQSYATGVVTGASGVGGLVGDNPGNPVELCYWDTTHSGRTTSDGGEGRTTAQMRQQGTYVQWDFSGGWSIMAGRNEGYPYLRRVGPWLLRSLAVASAVASDTGRKLWDVSGTYSTTLADLPLTLNLVHDIKGRVTGTAALDLSPAGDPAVTPVNLSLKGSVRGLGGGLVLKLKMKGTNRAGTERAELSADLSLDVAARRLSGPLTGSLRTAAGTTPVTDTLGLALPATMDGAWTLLIDLSGQGRTRSGSALLALSIGVEHPFAVGGRAVGQTLGLKLTGEGLGPAARGIRIKARVTPQEGGWAGLDAFAATAYGQTLDW